MINLDESHGHEDDCPLQSSTLNGTSLRNDNDSDLAATLPLKIPIIGFETMEERAKFTIFKLRIENDKLDDGWLVFKRYTDFVRLHQKLKEEHPDATISIPPKRWLRDNFETAFLEERMKGLQALVDSILLQPKLVALPIVRKFFCLDEPPIYSDTAEETNSWCGIIEDSAVMLRHKLGEKEREIGLLRAELALVSVQKDNLLKAVRNCSTCNRKPAVLSASNLTPCSSTAAVPSSSSSSDYGSSPRHFQPSQQNQLLHKYRRNSTSSRNSSVHTAASSSSHRNKRLSNGSNEQILLDNNIAGSVSTTTKDIVSDGSK